MWGKFDCGFGRVAQFCGKNSRKSIFTLGLVNARQRVLDIWLLKPGLRLSCDFRLKNLCILSKKLF